ncbi:FAD-dependent monooxygenase [Streptomyces sp. B-S-A8]|uniref:FAD-dependent monooxygenase n=1 Tax=Streptomyces solicavernae TaxID=3043614 RepID=A0ABT6RPC9_9ACTN|nr:FAD-dependent monooxygenase [Streptomyces sp. B-S-A8]MDI3386269.1 FAD-dependent monooxygenase [Streptomyces sp. B-S-A8]
MTQPVGQKRAVVVGGSLAGLLAAHVLTEHADRVTVVERDRLHSEPVPRPGVPQSRHTHVLVDGGQRALDELLPGFMDELRAAGSPRVGMPEDMVQWQGGRWFRRTTASMYIHTGTRPQLELLVRQRVLANPAIEVVEGAEAVGLLGNAARVRGVLLRERGAGGQERGARGAEGAEPLAADLVVDASGRGSRAPQWLAGIGADAPYEETIDTGLAYASRVYRDRSGRLGEHARGFNIVADPTQPYGAVVAPLEDGTCMVTLSGLRGAEPPTDDEEFTAFAKLLPHPVVHRWLRDAEPLTPAYGFRRTANVRRRYDLPGRRPAGFLATGDALCTFNPIYGQGMSVAARNALALRDALADPRRTPTTRRVQRAVLASSGQAWDISAGADRKMPGADGNAVAAGVLDRPAGWYLGRVIERCGTDPVVGDAFRSVLTLTAPLTSLFAPRVAGRVLFGPVVPAPTEPPMVREGVSEPVRP